MKKNGRIDRFGLTRNYISNIIYNIWNKFLPGDFNPSTMHQKNPFFSDN